MCGIAGFIDDLAERPAREVEALLRRMTDTLVHRGPDGEGIWLDAQAGVGLGHRRLSIIDLSPAGAQPMLSSCGRYVLSYNGEVYNFQELRRELEDKGHRFRGHSDTEVIAEACSAWGVQATAVRLNGIYGFAVWDRHMRLLRLVRDRLGVKPLYWAAVEGTFLFGSELKALRAHPGWSPEIDREALSAFFRHGYVPAPRSIYRGVRKLQPGSILTVASGRPPEIEAYWSARETAVEGCLRRSVDLAPEQAVDWLEELLKDAVGHQMIADVPIGSFLSGGIDSSTVTALMQAQSARKVRTFSIGFHDPKYNEAEHAKAVARHLGTDHTELYAAPAHARDLIPGIPDWFDEPFADSSQLPTYLVAQMTREHVTVALSGDGGDELFAGYNRYYWAEAIWRRIERLPLSIRRGAAAFISGIPTETWDRLAALTSSKCVPRLPGDKLHKIASVLPLQGEDDLYRRLVSYWDEPDSVVLHGNEFHGILWDETVRADLPHFLERMQFFDTVTYMPDDILTKVDRTSMAVSLEARVPLLDHRVVEFAWSLPRSLKIRDGKSKWLLRQVLYRHVPEDLVERPKMGFGVPIGTWLRGPLRAWAEALLEPARLRGQGLLNVDVIQRKWREHLSGRRNWEYQLWTALMFEAWMDRWICG